ncbi:penicillin acylase family protein [candidate division KSB1 bacterium]|nr:penicillin acylase family protein [candidate division KSB1 bacterium]
MKYLKALLAILLTAAIFYGLNFPHKKIPPIGKLLNPFAGFWRNNIATDQLPGDLRLDGLKGPVTTLFDDRLVPHIFARNDHDLYFAQGYITAKYRLWQMEIQTHSAAGRLSEILGRETVEYDRFMRRIGLTYAAEKSLRAVEQVPELHQAVDAYCDGVNAYIQSLKPGDYPVEYKLLDYAPEPYTPLKGMLLLKYMAWDLTGYNSDKVMTQAAQTLDPATMKLLYPMHAPLTEPVIPAGTRWPFEPNIPIVPRQPASVPFSHTQNMPKKHSRGSNNWAVSGSKTKNGHAILCNDPHLGLHLPAIWYEIQLSSPTHTVYGVSLPGAPFIIIGFNNHLAWGLTNAYSDVIDWYTIRFKDEGCREYEYNKGWQQASQRIEKIKVRNSSALLDTVMYTHHGPVVYRSHEKPYYASIPAGAALRWKGHDPSNEAYAIYLLNRAADYAAFVRALSFYECPAQNFAYADTAGNIAIWHNGRFPLRWPEQGRYIMDGSMAENGWQGWVPHAHNPHSLNPDRGFVSSANQKPVDNSYPYYLGWDYGSFERGARINQLLRQMHQISPQDMANMQLDDLSIFARELMPALLAEISRENLIDTEKAALAVLEKWDCRFRRDAIAPTIFTRWREELAKVIFEDDLSTATRRLKYPDSEVMLQLIALEADNPLIDDKNTAVHDTLAGLSASSLRAAIEKLTQQWGDMGESWQWRHTRGTDIHHLAQIPGFGRTALPTDGNHDTINAIGKRHGPSWRMVVELNRPVTAYGIYPGGQSGNPGSEYYDSMVDDWLAGKIYRLLFLQTPDKDHDQIISKTELRGKP